MEYFNTFSQALACWISHKYANMRKQKDGLWLVTYSD